MAAFHEKVHPGEGRGGRGGEVCVCGYLAQLARSKTTMGATHQMHRMSRLCLRSLVSGLGAVWILFTLLACGRRGNVI